MVAPVTYSSQTSFLASHIDPSRPGSVCKCQADIDRSTQGPDNVDSVCKRGELFTDSQ